MVFFYIFAFLSFQNLSIFYFINPFNFQQFPITGTFQKSSLFWHPVLTSIERYFHMIYYYQIVNVAVGFWYFLRRILVRKGIRQGPTDSVRIYCIARTRDESIHTVIDYTVFTNQSPDVPVCKTLSQNHYINRKSFLNRVKHTLLCTPRGNTFNYRIHVLSNKKIRLHTFTADLPGQTTLVLRKRWQV